MAHWLLDPTSADQIDREATELIDDANPGPLNRHLAKPLEITHSWTPDREAMAAALRVVLGLPRLPSGRQERQW